MATWSISDEHIVLEYQELAPGIGHVKAMFQPTPLGAECRLAEIGLRCIFLGPSVSSSFQQFDCETLR